MSCNCVIVKLNRDMWTPNAVYLTFSIELLRMQKRGGADSLVSSRAKETYQPSSGEYVPLSVQLRWIRTLPASLYVPLTSSTQVKIKYVPITSPKYVILTIQAQVNYSSLASQLPSSPAHATTSPSQPSSTIFRRMIQKYTVSLIYLYWTFSVLVILTRLNCTQVESGQQSCMVWRKTFALGSSVCRKRSLWHI